MNAKHLLLILWVLYNIQVNLCHLEEKPITKNVQDCNMASNNISFCPWWIWCLWWLCVPVFNSQFWGINEYKAVSETATSATATARSRVSAYSSTLTRGSRRSCSRIRRFGHGLNEVITIVWERPHAVKNTGYCLSCHGLQFSLWWKIFKERQSATTRESSMLKVIPWASNSSLTSVLAKIPPGV